MAYPINPNDVMMATLRGFLFGQEVMTTLHYRSAVGSPIVTNGSVALDDIFTQMDLPGGICEDFIASMPPQFGEFKLDLQWIYPLRYRKQTYTPTTTIGTGDATTVTNLAASIEIHGQEASKRSRCVKHIPGVGGDSCDTGFLTAAYKANLVGYVAELQADITAGGHSYEPIIWGKPRSAYTQCGRDYPALPALRTDIYGASIGDTVRVQRGRTVGVGK